jgi:uncharacterized protein (DUF2236 family)
MVERPFSDARPAGPFVEQSGEMPRPDAPAAGRREARTEDEILEFLDRAVTSRWANNYAPRLVEGLTNIPAESFSEEKINEFKLRAAAGIIARPRYGRDVDEIMELYIDNRDYPVTDEFRDNL